MHSAVRSITLRHNLKQKGARAVNSYTGAHLNIVPGTMLDISFMEGNEPCLNCF
jgi:hypothetical protein